MQLPFSQANQTFGPVLDRACSTGMWIAVNRPFAMGAMVHGGADKREAFRFIRQRGFAGAISHRNHLGRPTCARTGKRFRSERGKKCRSKAGHR